MNTLLLLGVILGMVGIVTSALARNWTAVIWATVFTLAEFGWYLKP